MSNKYNLPVTIFLCLCLGIVPGTVFPVQSQIISDSIVNLALSARVSTVNIAANSKKLAENVNNGVIDNNPSNCWVPVPEKVSYSDPAVLVCSWDRKVIINGVRIVGLPRGGQVWQLKDYQIGRGRSGVPPTELDLPEALEYRDVYTKGEANYYTFRIPVLTITQKGTLLAVCEARKNNLADQGDIDIVIKRSTDNGKTWSPLSVIYGADHKGTVGNPVVISDKQTGAIHLIFCIDEKRIFHTSSNDDGVHFDKPNDITRQIDALCAPSGFKWNKIWSGPGHGLQTKSGRLMVGVKPAGLKQDGATRRVGIIYSDDHGISWKAGGMVPTTLGEISESTLFETGEGEIILNVRWHEGNYRVVSKSTDGGLTWSKPYAEKELPDAGCEGSIIRYSDNKKDQRVYFTNLGHKQSGTANRKGLTLSMSSDDGNSWKQILKICEGPSGYSDIAVDREGRLLVLFERGTEIYSEKISLVWIEPDATDTLRNALRRRKKTPFHKILFDRGQWEEIVSVSAERAEPSIVHQFKEPVQTDNLILFISGATQPQGSVYLQELEIYGKPVNNMPNE